MFCLSLAFIVSLVKTPLAACLCGAAGHCFIFSARVRVCFCCLAFLCIPGENVIEAFFYLFFFRSFGETGRTHPPPLERSPTVLLALLGRRPLVESEGDTQTFLCVGRMGGFRMIVSCAHGPSSTNFSNLSHTMVSYSGRCRGGGSVLDVIAAYLALRGRQCSLAYL